MGTSFSICLYRYKSISAPRRDSRCLTEQEYWDEPSTVGRVKSFGVKTRLPVASHHPPNSLAILPSPTWFPPTSIIFRRQSSPPKTPPCLQSRLCAYAEPRGNDLAFADVWLGKTCRSPFAIFFSFQSKTFKSFSPPMYQNIKTEMSSPLSGDNFPWVKPIEHYSAVSNLSGKVLERYSRTLDAPCLVACEIWRRDSVQQLHFSTPPALFFFFSFFLHVNGESVRVSRSSANSSGVC